MKGFAAAIIMLLPAFLNAASFSDIMTAAQTHGTAVSSAAEEYESGMIGAYLASLDESVSVAVSAALFLKVVHEFEDSVLLVIRPEVRSANHDYSAHR